MLLATAANTPRTYLIFGSFCLSMFFFVWFFVPETKGEPAFSPPVWLSADAKIGLSLEAMDELFGTSDTEPKAEVTETRKREVNIEEIKV